MDDWAALDRDDFDAVDFINARFPSEHSLAKLPPFSAEVNAKILELDADISTAVARQSDAGLTVTKDVMDAREAIGELFGKIREIKGKAEQSEVMVQEICRDIKQLDYAKKHLQATITALKRLHMLVTAVDQLQHMAEERYYREAANLLDAVQQLLSHFEPYADIPKIAEIREMVQLIKGRLTSQIHEAFDEIGALTSTVASASDIAADPPGDGGSAGRGGGGGAFSSLSEACLVVDALGADARRRQLSKFCSEQLAPYAVLFAEDAEAASLEQVERRFAWFKRLLRGFDDRFRGVFPPHWDVERSLCLVFLSQTKAQLQSVLQRSADASAGSSAADEEQQVEVLLRALQKCLHFEREMAARFEAPAAGAAATTGDAAADADVVKAKYRRKAEAEAAGGGGGGGGAAGSGEDAPGIGGQLTALFDPFLGPYLSLERRNLTKIAASVSAEGVDSVRGDVANLSVLSSSVELFMYIKGSVKRCTALTTGQAFLELFREYRGAVRLYAQLLEQKIGALVAKSPLQGGAELALCHVVTTAEYCGDTLPQLEELVARRIDPALAGEVSCEEEQDAFHDASAAAVGALVGGLDGLLAPAFRSFAGIGWSSLSAVEEESPYVLMVQRTLLSFVPRVRERLPPVFFRSFCDKFCGGFLQRFHGLIMRQRRVSNEGLQQLLLDLYSVDKVLNMLPSLGAGGGAKEANPPRAPPIAYKRLVGGHIKRIESSLKLAQIPKEILVEEFKRMFADARPEELQAIMSLKGLKRQEQLQLLEELGAANSEKAVQAANRADEQQQQQPLPPPPQQPQQQQQQQQQAAGAARVQAAAPELGTVDAEADKPLAGAAKSGFNSLRLGFTSAMRSVGQKGGLFGDDQKS